MTSTIKNVKPEAGLKNEAYLSLFSGIGGLEHPTLPPVLFCEQDAHCHNVIRNRDGYRHVPIHSDIRALYDPPSASYVVGGWPCQDISSAGKQQGLSGNRSGLFFDMLRVAEASGAHTIIGENVPNLLTLNRGRDFEAARSAAQSFGFGHISWRTLNARSFGLPQDRSRLFIVASKHPSSALSLHCAVPPHLASKATLSVHGFYWTGGKRSLCYSAGYVPALKVGATDNRGRGAVAVFDGRVARKLTVKENLSLQGFSDDILSSGLAPTTLLRMAGNAVAKPVGEFVVSSVMNGCPASGRRSRHSRPSSSGYFDGKEEFAIVHKETALATNLADFLEPGAHPRLSPQASAGIIVRCVRSATPMPPELFDFLYQQSLHRDRKIHPSRSDSFSAFADLLPQIIQYRNSLEKLAVGGAS